MSAWIALTVTWKSLAAWARWEPTARAGRTRGREEQGQHQREGEDVSGETGGVQRQGEGGRGRAREGGHFSSALLCSSLTRSEDANSIGEKEEAEIDDKEREGILGD